MKFPSHRRDFLLKGCNTNVLFRTLTSPMLPRACCSEKCRTCEQGGTVLFRPMEFKPEGELAPVLNLTEVGLVSGGKFRRRLEQT